MESQKKELKDLLNFSNKFEEVNEIDELFDKIDWKIYDIENFDYEKTLFKIDSEIIQLLSRNLKINFNKIKEKLETEFTLEKLCQLFTLSLYFYHSDYSIFAGRLLTWSLKQCVHKNFYDSQKALQSSKYVGDENYLNIFDDNYCVFLETFKDELNDIIKENRDYRFDYFGIKTILNGYTLSLFKTDKCIYEDNHNFYNESIDYQHLVYETPQYMYLRMAIALHFENFSLSNEKIFKKIRETYELLSLGFISHASPTIFNAALKSKQYSSCVVLSMEDDMKSIGRITAEHFNLGSHAAGISIKYDIRPKGSIIRSKSGTSPGLLPLLKVSDAVTDYAKQGAGKRKGAAVTYLNMWHAEIVSFLCIRNEHLVDMKSIPESLLKTTDRNSITTKLFHMKNALNIPDLFFERVEKNEVWSLFSPDVCPDLEYCFGKEFNSLYTKYEKQGKYTYQVKACELYEFWISNYIVTQGPYAVCQENANYPSNHSNVGKITHSNLCTEILEVTQPKKNETYYKGLDWLSQKESPDESNTHGNWTAMCNLATLVLPNFFEKETLKFNVRKYGKCVRILVRNLNNIIDFQNYVTDKSKLSNLLLRNIGLGWQGLADLIALFDLNFDEELSIKFNSFLAELTYYYALDESNIISKERGKYPYFEGSPSSKGILHFDYFKDVPFSGYFDWDTLKLNIKTHGLSNSLLIAPPPTASTSQINDVNESIEPFMEVLNLRKTNAGSFKKINKYFVKDMEKLGLWNDKNAKEITKYESIQNIDFIPEKIKMKYRSAREIDLYDQLNVLVARNYFIDQSTSFNMYIDKKKDSVFMQKFIMEAWKRKVKTFYYLNQEKLAKPINFGRDEFNFKSNRKKTPSKKEENDYCESCQA